VILPRGYELDGEPRLVAGGSGSRIVTTEELGQIRLLAYGPNGRLGDGTGRVGLEIPIAQRWNGGQGSADLTVTNLLVCDPAGRPLALSDQPSAGEPAPGTVRTYLSQVQPNPMHGVSQVEYALERSGGVRLSVFDAAGRKVRSLWDGWQMAGAHVLAWDGRDDQGRDVPEGLYFVRLETERTGETRKLVVVR
jgi:hypothetical protein